MMMAFLDAIKTISLPKLNDFCDTPTDAPVFPSRFSGSFAKSNNGDNIVVNLADIKITFNHHKKRKKREC